MNIFTTRSRIVVTCNKRLSAYLQEEILGLGFQTIRTFPTGVEMEGTANDCIRLNLNLRCASQVLYSLRTFTAGGPEDIYQNVSQLPWESLVSPQGYFSVTSNVSHPSIRTSMFANVRVKDAVVDRIRSKTGTRPYSGPRVDNAVIHLFWKNEAAEIFIDTSGETLAKHGYRKIPGKAPMLEALALATLLAGKWDRTSPFINPMCGSGTLAIEAALLATNRRPGLFRANYSFMYFSAYADTIYRQECLRLQEQVLDNPDLIVEASDISEDAVRIARINAAAAGVADRIRFAVCDFQEAAVPAGKQGVIYFNPEYGERLGVALELQATYARIGDFLKQKGMGYTGYIFTGNLDLAKNIGLKASRRIEFYTGKIDCRLLEYELYAGKR